MEWNGKEWNWTEQNGIESKHMISFPISLFQSLRGISFIDMNQIIFLHFENYWKL